MPLILGANSVSGYTVKNSLRFNSGSNDNLTRTPASATNRRTFTISTWFKRSTISTRQTLFSQYLALNNNEWFEYRIDTDDTLSLSWYSAGVFSTSQVFRDPSAWYHIVLAVDTTQATSTDRIKLYVNGSQVTSFSSITYPAQNYDTGYNQSSSLHIGDLSLNGNFDLNGYLAECYSIDGQQLTPSSFGETDTLSGIWIPKAYTGSYGTNGFYLKFANSGALGTDSSGNGNTFTVNNLTSVDQSTDTCTNNFATFNPVDVTSGNVTTFIDGNLNVRHGSGPSGAVCAERSTIAVSKGKWYWETKCIATGGDVRTGIISMSSSNYATSANPYSPNDSYNYKQTGQKGTSSGDTAYGATYTAGDIISILYDADNGSLTFYKNGVSQGVAFSGLDTSLTWGAFSTEYNGGEFSYNFGSPIYAANAYADGAGYGNFSYAVPSGYYSLNTKNLATYG